MRQGIGRARHSRGALGNARAAGRAAGGAGLALLGLGLVATPADAAFGYRKTFTMQASQVSGGPHPNFPLLVSIPADPNLATVANGGHVASSFGHDIVFRGEDSTTCGGPSTCRLDHEIERYDPATGALIAWVRVPSFRSSTKVHLYYGDSGITVPTEAPAAVWAPDSPALPGYVGVWHLEESGVGAPLEFRDSSKNGNHGQGGEGNALFLPTRVAGKIGYAQDFAPGATSNPKAPPPDGKFDVVDLGHSPRFDVPGNQLTLEAWVQHSIVPAFGDVYGFLSHKGASDGYRLMLGDGNLRVSFNVPGTSLLTTGTVGTGAWHHVVATYDGATMRVYIDGVQDPTTAARTGGIIAVPGSDGDLFIGHGDQPKDRIWSYEWVGQVDEVRISRVARSAGWILTEYQNQNSPATFYSVGAEDPGPYPTPAGALYTVNFRSVGTNAATLHDTGVASVALGARVVTFAGGASLPGNVGKGDALTFTGAPAETLYVHSRDSATQVTLQAPATSAHASQTYTITRAFTSLAAWEAARQGDLVTENRLEVGVCYNDGAFTAGADLSGWTTDPLRYPMLTVAAGHRHNGTAGTGVVLDGVNTDQGIRVSTSYTILDGLELRRNRGATGAASVVVQGNASDVRLQNLLVHDFSDAANDVAGIRGQDAADYTVRNTILYDGDVAGVRNDAATARGILENVTVHGMDGWGVLASAGTMFVRNTASMDNPSGDFAVGTGTMVQGANMSSDATATGSNPEPNRLAANQFVSIAPGSEDFHLKAGSNAIDQGWQVYTPQYSTDIDGFLRPLTPVPDVLVPGPWDIGADEFGATTAVDLVAFTARGLDGAVELRWETGSEMDTLGFHVYRGTGAAGPWERVTASVVPGLGFSPEGARYSYTDTSLQNGRTYFYLLEEVETTGGTARHGPVTATPAPGGAPGDGGPGVTGPGGSGGEGERAAGPGEDGGEEGGTAEPLVYGDPDRSSLSVRTSDGGSVVLDLRTGGFRATRLGDGTVALEVPGFDGEREPGWPALPSRLAWVETLAGRSVTVSSVREMDLVAFDLQPAAAPIPTLAVARDGTIRAAERPAVERRVTAGRVPGSAAEILETAFQGDKKKALVRLSPLRFDSGTGRLLLARRLEVRLSPAGRVAGEVPLGGSRGRLERRTPTRSPVLARLVTRAAGLHAVAFEDIARRSRRFSIPSSLRLSRRGETAPHWIEPPGSPFGPGSRLFFLSAGPDANPDGDECVYELEQSDEGLPMPSRDASPRGGELAQSLATARFERNVRYMPALLEAPDPWLWDAVGSASAKAFPFSIEDPLAPPAVASVLVHLVGGSDFPVDPDHHVRVSVNGVPVADASWDGLASRAIEAGFDSALLRDGENTLEVRNVGDTAAGASFVHLDRFEVQYPRKLAARAGQFEGRFEGSGVAAVSGLARAHLLDTTTRDRPIWLSGASDTPLRFRAEEGRTYLVVSADAVLTPEVRFPARTRLLDTRGASHVVIAPRAFLEAAETLVAHRVSQGLRSRAVAVEEVFDVFGHGERHPGALRDFLAFAFHHWAEPPRYVLLLGDATHDPKDFLGTGAVNPVPALVVPTRYLRTAVDPLLGAVNGEDALPDVAVGRLPAASPEEALALVHKLIDYESAGRSTRLGRAVLVADNTDRGGTFDANADEIRTTLLAGRETTDIRIAREGPATRAAILGAFDDGASLMSYMGHGGTLIWAGENVFNVWDVPALRVQSQQPLVLTLNCLNGYFTVPAFDSLAEALVKAEGRGAIAAFSPSSVSLDGAAHAYHKAVLKQLLGGGHPRLGDALLAAQAEAAFSSPQPELFITYHLFGDPALRLP